MRCRLSVSRSPEVRNRRGPPDRRIADHPPAAADRNGKGTESPRPSKPGPRRTELPMASASRQTMPSPKPRRERCNRSSQLVSGVGEEPSFCVEPVGLA